VRSHHPERRHAAALQIIAADCGVCRGLRFLMLGSLFLRLVTELELLEFVGVAGGVSASSPDKSCVRLDRASFFLWKHSSACETKVGRSIPVFSADLLRFFISNDSDFLFAQILCRRLSSAGGAKWEPGDGGELAVKACLLGDTGFGRHALPAASPVFPGTPNATDSPAIIPSGKTLVMPVAAMMRTAMR
jgi:hypothetical protein